MERVKLLEEYRVSLYVIMGAFFLSLLLGFIRKNPGGVVLMRAFLSALLFGVIFQGGLYIIRRYIPELAGGEGKVEGRSASQAVSEDAGSVIDYRVGEEEGMPSPEPVSDEYHDSEEGRTEPVEGEEDIQLPESEEVASMEGEKAVSEDATLGDLPALENLFEEELEPEVDSKEEIIPRKERRSDIGEYIQIGDAHIPYEPKALAKAVKKVMKEDGTK
jgi:hypothetical protein